MSESAERAENPLMEGPGEVGGYLPPEKLDQILEEIAGFEIPLAEDPTLPELGMRYLQAQIAKCRGFLNRAQYYFQITKRYEKNLRMAEKAYGLDLEMKVSLKLADDQLVRQQPAAQERMATAISMLRSEHENLARFRVALQGVDDTIRIIKARYDDLRHTNQDIKLQRQMIKDDKMGWGTDEGGYVKPQSREDNTIPSGLAPPVRMEEINPSDLLDPDKRPEDLPEPKNASHAKQIASFFSGKPELRGASAGTGPAAPAAEATIPTPPPPAIKTMSYEELLGITDEGGPSLYGVNLMPGNRRV